MIFSSFIAFDRIMFRHIIPAAFGDDNIDPPGHHPIVIYPDTLTVSWDEGLERVNRQYIDFADAYMLVRDIIREQLGPRAENNFPGVSCPKCGGWIISGKVKAKIHKNPRNLRADSSKC